MIKNGLSPLPKQLLWKITLMIRTAQTFFNGALYSFMALALLAGAGTKADIISTAEKAHKKAGITAPGIAETKAIAEEAFIYGLPIVMNYAVMQEFAVDKNSGQFKAPFNTMYNDAAVFTYKDTAVVTPNSDTPYSMVWLDMRAEPMVISVPAVPEKRYYSVQFIDGNAYNYGYIGTRATGPDAGDYLVVGPDWKGEKPAGIREVFKSTTPFSLTIFRTQLFNPDDMPNVAKVHTGRIQGAATVRIPESACARRSTEDRLPPGYDRGHQG